MKHITYAIDEDGIVVSRVGSELAWPVLDYDAIGMGGDFRGPMLYHLERVTVGSATHEMRSFKWTKKIPCRLKNRHRKFWGMKPLTKKRGSK